MRFREDQKFWLSKWFENNPVKEYQVLLLNWLNRYKNICILFFLVYYFSSICNLNSKVNINVGENLKVRNTINNNNDIIYFELI